VPLMAGNFGYTPSSMGGFGGGPSGNNFYRSESYSYSSDGSGPPQIEQNVFDSRLGHHGISNF
ncbi:CG10680, partial [Drosophila busckii]